MLGAQMAGTHALAMELLARARHAEHVPRTSDYVNLAVRLLRTYTAQMETLAKIRRKGGQTVRVEHVHVHEGGQAIVGNVNAADRAGGALNEIRGQPHAPCRETAVEHASGTEVSGQDKSWDSVPVAFGQGAEEMPNAWRSQRQRGS